MKFIEREKIKELLEKDGEFKLVNVLSRESFGKVRIPGSINIPLKENDFEVRFSTIILDKNSKIVVHCSGPD